MRGIFAKLNMNSQIMHCNQELVLFTCLWKDGKKDFVLRVGQSLQGMLKTKYGEQFLIAMGRDSNVQYFPSAFAVIEIATKVCLNWFLILLLEDIRDV